MAETLGSLCDKLTVLKLKQWHSQNPEQIKNLSAQEIMLINELNQYIGAVINGLIPLEMLDFPSNKVYQKETNPVKEYDGNLSELISKLAEVNCRLWHQQEKVYEFDKVPVMEKNDVIKELAILNLERNQCIDKINGTLQFLVTQQKDSMIKKR